MDMERQIAQFYLQKPGGNRGGDPLATALSNVASGLVSGIKMDSELKTAALNRELAEAREARAKENQEIAKQEREEAKKDKEDAKRQEKLEKMTTPKANENADGISQYLISQPEFGNMTPEMIIEASVTLANDGKTVVDVQDQLERQRQQGQRAAASETSAEASEKRATTTERKREDVVEGRTGGGAAKSESEAGLTNLGQANAADTVGKWEEEVDRPITMEEVTTLRDIARQNLQDVQDERERKILLAEIEAYEAMMMKTDLDRSAGPARDIKTRGQL
jgi:hypothetical protein